MTIITNTDDRKALAKAIAEELGMTAHFLGIASCGYQVGDYIVDRNGNIIGEDFGALRDFLLRRGYIQEEAPADSGETRDAEPAHTSECTEGGLELSIPIGEIEPRQMINLIRILYARQKLLAAMTLYDGINMDRELIELIEQERPETVWRIYELVQHKVNSDMLRGINVTDDTFTLTLGGSYHRNGLTTYVRLMNAILRRAKEAGFVSAKLIDPADGEMKYCVNGFLNQLGFGGADHKEDRRVLMGHIKGYAAFKSAEGMERHKHRQQEKRKAAKEIITLQASEHQEGEVTE